MGGNPIVRPARRRRMRVDLPEYDGARPSFAHTTPATSIRRSHMGRFIGFLYGVICYVVFLDRVRPRPTARPRKPRPTPKR
jgi:hypothetical protein